MKTFLRTTLFRFVVFIAFLIISGFGYNDWRLAPVFNQHYLVKRLPTPVVQEIEWQGWDKALQEQDNNEPSSWNTVVETTTPAAGIETGGPSNITTLPATFSQEVSEASFNDLKVDLADVKQTLSQQLTDQLNQLYTLMAQQAQRIASSCQSNGEETAPVAVDLKAQRATELQTQIQQLQAEMDSLYQ